MRGPTASTDASSRRSGVTARVVMTFVFLVLLALTTGATSFGFAQHPSSAYTYDVAANARIDGHGFEAVDDIEAGPAELSRGRTRGSSRSTGSSATSC